MTKITLTTCPSNLKEAIDWILRVTGKDGGGGGQNASQELATAVSTLLKGVQSSSPELQKNIGAITQALSSGNNNGIINALGEGLKKFKEGIQKKSDENVYDDLKNPHSLNTKVTNAAKIFLGCVPLCFYSLSYLYWKCKHGDWAAQPFDGKGRGQNLKAFMVGQGYSADHLSTQTGSDIVNALGGLDQFSAVTATQPSHPDLLNELNKSLQRVIGSSGSINSVSFNDHALSALFYLCRTYFTGRQIMQSGSPTFKPRPPTSIREMLYWLSGLQFSPNYLDVEKQIDSHIPFEGLHVADSSIASATRSNGDTLTQNQMKGFLLSSCLSAPGVLGAIQGNTADPNGPWLHSLFSNTMNLQSPSGSALFNTLANYAYALQFQLGFLYQQCANGYSYTCGWQWCRYGHSVQSSNQKTDGLASWICSAPDCSNMSGCQHNSEKCEHIMQCGQSDKRSPLQAFLTDNLKGFHVAKQPIPYSSNHLDNHPSGSMCHVPMGFASALTTDTNATGWYIYYILDHFCSGPYTPLRQLCEKLSCLTRRTPRSLGDVFGFIWTLNYQLFKGRPKMVDLIGKFDKALGINGSLSAQFTTEPYSVLAKIWNKIAELNPGSPRSSSTILSRSLETMAPTTPFLYQLFMAKEPNTLPGAFFDLTQHCHKLKGYQYKHESHDSSSRSCSNPNDLWSLYQPVSAAPMSGTDTQAACRGAKCGGYLSPLTHSAGATYAPVHASVYLSWLAYLTDDFHEWFQNLLDEFKNIDCSKSGCRGTKGKTCSTSHARGTHGTASGQCQCDSVVHCGGVLPLLYANGFGFHNAYSLKGGMHGSDPTKRSCQQFHDQLSNVLSPDAPLHNLLLAIDDFLYLFRFYFLYNLSAIWALYFCIILYTLFFILDTLHLRSHLRFSSSHILPPTALLTTGKAPALTKLTYFVP
ncbi:variant erythrocyte surface antigen-1 family protein [Babesia caballi]|uniref:Variant erythrocyte surface antigen-1 family protein n=1 Tax=Babesia caballi TaxID=5871 RepID=A0AAV4LSR2_BABCB|nr:variant erythrocyte surface antigen-1 family protein [Babesia caballi]